MTHTVTPIVFLLAILLKSTPTALAMTWATTWKDILGGGPARWKVNDLKLKQQALACIEKYVKDETAFTSVSADNDRKETGAGTALKILCPLAGDDQFIHQAWSVGHSVTSIDIVPDAVAAMREQFGGDNNDWTLEEKQSTRIWKHKSGRATLYEGDVMAIRPELKSQFDAIYDKDSFGALEKQMRPKFCERLADYAKDDAIVYIEVKYKDEDSPGRLTGPPYHVVKEDLMEATSFGSKFDYTAGLGKIYEVAMPGMYQTGHILRRMRRD